MNPIRNLLQEADPLRVELEPSAADRIRQRQAILTAAVNTPLRATESRSRIPIYLSILLALIMMVIVALRLWTPFIDDAQAAVRFELRLAEQNPAPGLREATGPGGQTLYLHGEALATNSDIAQGKVIPGPSGSGYAIEVAFKPSAATAESWQRL
jgi:hypothetical protein